MSNQVITEIRHNLSRMEPEFQKALPSHISVEKFTRVAMSAIQRDPYLLQADRASLFACCMNAAQDGLLLDGREAAAVTFKGKATYMPMIAGILKKIRNSGDLKSIAAHVVREGDEFDYYVDEQGEHFRHRPNLDDDGTGKIRLVYAVAITKDGGTYFDRMTHAEVEKVRKASRSGDRGPWADWWEEMAKKTIIRRLSKRLPMSTDLPMDDEEFRPQFTPAQDDAPAAAKPERNSKLAQVLAGRDTGDPEHIKDAEAEIVDDGTISEEDPL